MKSSEIVWTPNGCPHGPPLPKEGGRYCVSCQHGSQETVAPCEGGGSFSAAQLASLLAQPDPYLTEQPCASPHAATVYVEGPVNETPHVRRARRQREAE